MKILIVGGTGTIGSAVANELKGRHDLIIVGHKHGDLQVDITSMESIEKMFQSIGKLDAVISTAGKVKFAPLSEMRNEDYEIGLKDKLMGQVNLVLIGQQYVNQGGSFTLTGGILSHDPIRSGSSASMVNRALEGFVIAAAIELPFSQRINLVSPTVITESLPHFGPYFRGFESVTSQRAALAYSKSVEGAQTGQIYYVK